MLDSPEAVRVPRAFNVTFSTIWLPATVETPSKFSNLSYPVEESKVSAYAFVSSHSATASLSNLRKSILMAKFTS